MVVRIRVNLPGPKGPSRAGRPPGEAARQLALAVASLFNPAAVMAVALAVWRIAADLKWAGEFAFQSGLLSHWQVWTALAAALKLCSIALGEWGRETRERGGRARREMFLSGPTLLPPRETADKTVRR